jgi:hypothetical protein
MNGCSEAAHDRKILRALLALGSGTEVFCSPPVIEIKIFGTTFPQKHRLTIPTHADQYLSATEHTAALFQFIFHSRRFASRWCAAAYGHGLTAATCNRAICMDAGGDAAEVGPLTTHRLPDSKGVWGNMDVLRSWRPMRKAKSRNPKDAIGEMLSALFALSSFCILPFVFCFSAKLRLPEMAETSKYPGLASGKGLSCRTPLPHSWRVSRFGFAGKYDIVAAPSLRLR